MPKISIIVPVHNTEEYLQECLDSLAAQTISDLEVICIDDGSTDQSEDMLRKYAERDQRFRVFSHPEALGPGAVRNKGIALASGDFIGFVDSDDYIHPKMYEDLLSAFGVGEDIDFTICGIEKFSDSGAEKFAKGEQERLLSAFAGRSVNWEMFGDRIFDLRFGCCNRLYRRDFLNSSGARFSEGIFYEDLIFHFKVFTQARGFSGIEAPHYKNRRQRRGATTFEQGGRVVGLVTALSQLDEYLKSDARLAVLEEKFVYFSYKKTREHFHKCDFESMPAMFQYMQYMARDRVRDGNQFVTDADRDVLQIVRDMSFSDYLAWDYWQSKTAVARLKRRVRSAQLKNRKLMFRANSIGAMLGSMRSITLRREKLFIWRVFRKLGLPVVIVNNGQAQAAVPKKVAPVVSDTYRRDSEKNRYDAVDFLRMREVDSLNAAVIERVKRKLSTGSGTLRVGFLVNDFTKWSGGSLLADLSRSGSVECGFICALNHNAHKLTRETRREEYERTREAFSAVGPVWEDLYDVDTDLVKPVEEINCDMVFLQQPWGMMDVPRRLSGRVLCAYIHYGFVVMGNHGMHYNIAEFHSYLWKYFAQTEPHKHMHLTVDPSAYNKIEVVGYPKLDVYLGNAVERSDVKVWKNYQDTARKRIIFAPHHSFGAKTLRMATLRWSGPEIEQIRTQLGARADWVFKPHPNLRNTVWRSKVMTVDEYQIYVNGWAHGENSAVYEDGEYFDLFRSSDVLVTDCGSFLAEYLPTGKPIIWLAAKGAVKLNAVGANLAEAFYVARNASELREVFESVVVRGEDPLKDLREQKIAQVMPHGKPSSQIISEFILSNFDLEHRPQPLPEELQLADHF